MKMYVSRNVSYGALLWRCCVVLAILASQNDSPCPGLSQNLKVITGTSDGRQYVSNRIKKSNVCSVTCSATKNTSNPPMDCQHKGTTMRNAISCRDVIMVYFTDVVFFAQGTGWHHHSHTFKTSDHLWHNFNFDVLTRKYDMLVIYYHHDLRFFKCYN